MRRPKRHSNRRHVIYTARVRKEYYAKQCATLQLFLRESEADNRRVSKVAVDLFDECRRLKKLLNDAQANTEVKKV